MPEDVDSNEAIWKSDRAVSQWVSTAEERERRRDQQRRLVAELLPFGEDETFTFVDLGAGTGAAARAVLDRYPGATAILAEYSPQMIAEGERALGAYRGRYTYVEFDLNGDRWPADISGELDAVISSMCLHHLPDERRESLFAEILARLTPGGWFLNFDPVTSDDPGVRTAWQRAGHRLDPATAVEPAHRSPEEQRRHENHVRHMSPLPRQLDALRRAGFEAIDVYWKQLDEVIYGGRRPTRAG
ncbi:class I SAM-dependent methyltransferase [Blastococcus saxobsidens]|uniref:Ubiquinone/menaquinone biosynthesis C-methylase UbiE n=1 Tax=Blastococcus saxobsidens TaxID=138336 RepID=A0A4Q7Y532_9ACTN|nr:class I SAM-dependent methyltransferase [Blastococcus saxobsidens]RZU30969.1 ubiquinone/menaquinone biosynthesis C-methylase UbiE [Blastococcus saxobsidens]